MKNNKNQNLPKALTQCNSEFKEDFQIYRQQVKFDLFKTIKSSNTESKAPRTPSKGFDTDWLEA
jgi:hypothetical protein